MVCQYETGWPILKQAAWPHYSFKTGWPVSKQVMPSLMPATACFKTGQIKIYLLIGLTGFKMGQILNRAVTKKSVPRQNWSSLANFGPPVKTWIYNNLAMHGLPAHAAAGCSDCHCSFRPYIY